MSDLFTPTPDHAALRDLARRFAEREVAPQAAAHDRAETMNLDLFRRMGDCGLAGLTAAPAHGGAGMDAVAIAIVHEELAWADAGFALAYLSHVVLFVHSLSTHGSPAQQARVLPDACAGRRIGGVAMSEAEAGTDVAAIRTTARRVGDGYVLDGAKMWITNGALDDAEMGDLFLVYARTSDQGARGLSLFLVEKGTPGFSLGRRIKDKLGMRSANCAELIFAGCAIPAANRIGAEGGAMLQMLQTLEIERLAMAALGIGIGLRALQTMNAYASQRRSGGQLLREHGQIQRHIADSYSELIAARALVYATASGLNGTATRRYADADAAKLRAAATAKAVADRAIQVLGANGYVGDYEVERLWRDARLLGIGGGSDEALQRNITRLLSREHERVC